jgi:PilZ domain-containing protein
MPERRSHARKKMVLPVKLSVGDATQLVHTVDITGGGTRLGGLRAALKVGETVILQRGSQKTRCRVAWVRQVGPNEIQAGLEWLEPQNKFLGVDLSDNEREGDKTVEMLMTLPSQDVRSGHLHK